MRTFVMITFSSEGGSASQVVNRLTDMGFDVNLGTHDFVYRWNKKDVSDDEVIALVEKVQKKLQGMNVMLQFATTQ